MLLIADETGKNRLKAILDTVGFCRSVLLEEADKLAPVYSFLICNVDSQRPGAPERLAAALAHHRTRSDMPFLFVAKDGDVTVAQALGANDVVPETASDAEIARVARLCRRLTLSPLGTAPRLPQREGSIEAVGQSMSGFFARAQQRQAISVDELQTGAKNLVESLKQIDLRDWLDVVRRYDDVTYQHCLLVAGLVASFSIRLGYSLSQQHLLSQAALVHDIGKAAIPQDILKKPGPLTEEERAVMRQHPALGHQMLMKQPGHHPVVLEVVLRHHEFLDGTGYPDGWSRRQITEPVRLVTICDIYAALIERRPYKAPMSREAARAVLAEMVNQLDVGLLKAFDGVIRDS